MEDKDDEQTEAVPQDVQQIILASLPGRIVLKFRAVCKFWRDCIEEPAFVDHHLKRALRFQQCIACFTSVDRGLVHMYTFDPTTMNFKSMDLVFSRRFHMSAPCNGLVCAYDMNGDVEVLNPTTRKHLGLPVLKLRSEALFSEYFMGFVPSTKEYKVVCVRHLVLFLTFQVCTIGTRSWRTIRGSAELLKTTKPVIVNDDMYWLLLDDGISSDSTGEMLVFNLTNERFSKAAVPYSVKHRDLELFEAEGCLRLLAMPGTGSTFPLSEIWAGVKAGQRTQVMWYHMHTVTHRIPLGTRPFFQHGTKLFYGNQKKFSYMDLKDESVSYVDIPSDECVISCGVFVESLLLRSMTGMVDSTALASRSHPGSSSEGAGHSAGWSSAEPVQSSKRAKKTVDMEWKMHGVIRRR